MAIGSGRKRIVSYIRTSAGSSNCHRIFNSEFGLKPVIYESAAAVNDENQPNRRRQAPTLIHYDHPDGG